MKAAKNSGRSGFCVGWMNAQPAELGACLIPQESRSTRARSPVCDSSRSPGMQARAGADRCPVKILMGERELSYYMDGMIWFRCIGWGTSGRWKEISFHDCADMWIYDQVALNWLSLRDVHMIANCLLCLITVRGHRVNAAKACLKIKMFAQIYAVEYMLYSP